MSTSTTIPAAGATGGPSTRSATPSPATPQKPRPSAPPQQPAPPPEKGHPSENEEKEGKKDPPAPEPVKTNPTVGDIVLVRLDHEVQRPMIITYAGTYDVNQPPTPQADALAPQLEYRLSGIVFCEPEDHARTLFRGWISGPIDPARIHGRPDRLAPFGYGEYLKEGTGIGQWSVRP